MTGRMNLLKRNQGPALFQTRRKAMSKYLLLPVFAIMMVLGPVLAQPPDSGHSDRAGHTVAAVS